MSLPFMITLRWSISAALCITAASMASACEGLASSATATSSTTTSSAHGLKQPTLSPQGSQSMETAKLPHRQEMGSIGGGGKDSSTSPTPQQDVGHHQRQQRTSCETESILSQPSPQPSGFCAISPNIDSARKFGRPGGLEEGDVGGDLNALADRVGDALLPAAHDGSTATLQTRSEDSIPSVPQWRTGRKSSHGEDDHRDDDDDDDDDDNKDRKPLTVGHKTQQQHNLSRTGEDSTKKTVARRQNADSSVLIPDELESNLHHEPDGRSSSNIEDSKETEVGCSEGGEHRKMCRKGDVCCNDTYGLCVLPGQTSVQASERSMSVRTLRREALRLSLDITGSLPPKDRLEKLKRQTPQLFEHVSINGFKRMLSQASEPPPTLDEPPPILARVATKTPSIPDPYLRHQLTLASTVDIGEEARGKGAAAGAIKIRRTGTSGEREREEQGEGNERQRIVSVGNVGHPVTGLADVDLVSTMQGLLDREVSVEMQEESDRLGRERADAVRGAMGHLWVGYTEHAWGNDEIKPLGRRGSNNWGGMGVTLVDSLDTLWLMGLKDDFFKGRDWVRDHLTFENAGLVSVFETTIRVLGGLLSAFDLSKDQVFLERAKELADRLMPAFGSSTGLPYKMVHLTSGATSGSSSVLSELGTLQLEFRYLSRALGNDHYAQKVTQVFDFLSKKKVPHGLYPIRINPDTGHFSGTKVTFGALGDSFYEYLLKVWLQGGRQENEYRRMYDEAMDGVAEVLVKKSGGLTYLSEWNGGESHQHRMDHLACFVAGNLALGAATADDPARAARDLQTGKALAYTCYQMYLRMPTGLPPETVDFDEGGKMRARTSSHFYVLRPETLESFFILHQLTRDPVYREWGWEIFRAIEQHCRVGVGFGSHPDVLDPSREAQDHMESFFPGETLKYLYLLMQPDHPIDLMKYTFNTEAHPLRIFS